jgi:hypothetical protein
MPSGSTPHISNAGLAEQAPLEAVRNIRRLRLLRAGRDVAQLDDRHPRIIVVLGADEPDRTGNDVAVAHRSTSRRLTTARTRRPTLI